MEPQTNTQPDEKLVSMLNDLIQLDYDAIEAYRAAIDRLEDDNARAKLETFMEDHVKHTRNLSKLIQQHGGTPKTKPDAKKALTKGKVVLANLAGDEAILKAMRTNEDETNEKYEKSLKTPGLDAATRSTLEANLQDEQRHRQWIIDRLERS
ncbi:MAG TPA: DUF892 family protein [Sandaracinaceae bacterium LLY-WYZ-13_1]|nr:DUF892 family protein [Sandaracinaceae bacterium LLY-WYZ-13_1]